MDDDPTASSKRPPADPPAGPPAGHRPLVFPRSHQTRSATVQSVATEHQVQAELRQLIATHGWAVRHVGQRSGPGGTAFSYTVGLTGFGHPEVVITGLPFEHAQTFLNNIGADVRGGQRFSAGLQTEDLTEPGAPVVFIRAENTTGLTAVGQIYGVVEAIQMIWPDSAGNLPWTEAYRNRPDAQPLLGPMPDR